MEISMSFLSTIQTTTTTKRIQGSALFHQLTSPQTVQAFVVVVLVSVMAYLVITGQNVPEAVATFVGVVMGYYFRGSDNTAITEDARDTRPVDVGELRAQHQRFLDRRGVADSDTDQGFPAKPDGGT